MDEMMIMENIMETVREASAFMREENFTVEQKGNESNFVTSADRAVQEFLCARLKKLLPGSKFFGEESDDGGEAVDMSGYLWIVDPIDGTANFMRGMRLSVISVALLKDGMQYMGVVYCPYTDEMFSACAGCGAYLNGKKIHVSDRPYHRGLLFSAMSLYDKSLAAPCFRIIEDVYDTADDLRRLGTAALELCYVAAGRGELYFEMRLSSWDYSAGTLILREAGGCFELMYRDGIVPDRPCPVVGANSEENLERLKEIFFRHVPTDPY